MQVNTYISLKDFDFWSGAKIFVDKLTEKELDTIEEYLLEKYPNGINRTSLNDMFWFSSDAIACILGTTSEEILSRGSVITCDKCGKEIQAGEKYFTAVGVYQCDNCNTNSNGTVSMDFIVDKIVKESDKK